MMPWTQEGVKQRMEEINGHIKSVSYFFIHPPRAGTSVLDTPFFGIRRVTSINLNENLKLICLLQGAITFLRKEYTALSIFIALFSVIVLCAVDMPWSSEHKFPFTMFAFIIGASTSMLCGYLGMAIATTANYKTTYLCNISKFDGFKVAF